MAKNSLVSIVSRYWRFILLILIPIALLPLPLAMNNSPQSLCSYIVLLMALYWVLEILPLSLTAMLPVVLAPFFKLMSIKDLSSAFFMDIHFLFIGGFMLGVAMEEQNLHRRIALAILNIFGTKPPLLLLGFMLPTWLLSMWMSNTASTIMMHPMVCAVIDELEVDAKKLVEEDNESEVIELQSTNKVGIDVEENIDSREMSTKKSVIDKLSVCYNLSIAYASNVGGVATLIGTGTNLVLVGQLEELFKNAETISFASWSAFAVPLSILSFFIIWLTLQICFLGVRKTFNCFNKTSDSPKEVKGRFKKQLDDLGPTRFAEKVILGSFVIVLIVLITGKIGKTFGWHLWFTNAKTGKSYVTDGSGMLLVGLALTIIPKDINFWKDKPKKASVFGFDPILSWKLVLQKIPFDLFLLIGGGISLARLCQATKLSESIGVTLFSVVSDLPVFVTIIIICFTVVWVTEVTSNMATASVLLPIISHLAQCLGVNPLMLMIPLAVTCSYAFCLPTGTPPNAVVFSRGKVTIKEMARVGTILNIIFAIIIPIFCMTWGEVVFSFSKIPKWANATMSSNCTTRN